MALAEASGRDRRADERHGVDLPATLRCYRLPPFEARICDISVSGAMVATGSEELHRGTELLLAAEGIELVATVAWTTDGHRGLVFHRRLSTAELSALRRIGRARH